jgi:hypothetical protein
MVSKVKAKKGTKKVARVKRINRSNILKNTLNVKFASAAPSLPGVGGGSFGGGGSSSSSAGAPASTTILTGQAGVGGNGNNDRIIELLTRIEAAGARARNVALTPGLGGVPMSIPGPRGERGLRGEQGLRGVGQRGEQGIPGRNSLVPGPAGLDSTVPGPRGAQGVQGVQGVSSFVYQPNGQLVPEHQGNNLGREANAVPEPDDNRLITALERIADRSQPRLQPVTPVTSETQLAINEVGRGTAQKRPLNQLAASIDQQAGVEQAAMDIGGLRAELDMHQRQRRDIMRAAAEGNLTVPLSGVGLTPSTSDALVRAGPIIEQLPDDPTSLAIRAPRDMVNRIPVQMPAEVPDQRETLGLGQQLTVRAGRNMVPRNPGPVQRVPTEQQLAVLRNQRLPPVQQQQGGQLVQRGARDLATFYAEQTDEFGDMES